jgi:hypothetical protein
MQSSFRATLMSADTGASQVYEFKADSGLFRKPARQIVREFMKQVKNEKEWRHPPSYRLDSATKKSRKEVVMATGSLVLEKGELPFLVMISPEVRDVTDDQPSQP